MSRAARSSALALVLAGAPACLNLDQQLEGEGMDFYFYADANTNVTKVYYEQIGDHGVKYHYGCWVPGDRLTAADVAGDANLTLMHYSVGYFGPGSVGCGLPSAMSLARLCETYTCDPNTPRGVARDSAAAPSATP